MTWEIEAQDIEKVGSFHARWANYPFVGLRQGSNSENPRPPTTKERTWMALDGKCRLYILLPLLFCCSPLMAKTDTTSKQICVVFRFDDPSAGSNTELEARLIEAFREHNMCCTWAVIPRPPLPKDKAELFGDAARAGVLEIALHGYSHRDNGLPERGRPCISEFVGLAYEDQLQKIQEGKKSLEAQLGLSISVFVPPYTSYDGNTLRSLEETQFRYLSASLFGWADSSTSLLFLPSTCSITAVQDAVITARAAPGPNPVIVVLFHGTAFREHNGKITFDRFIEMLQWLTRQQDVRIVPMSEVSDLSSERYLANQRIRTCLKWLPRTLHPHNSRVFFCKEGARNIRHMGVLRLVGFYGGLMLAVGAVAFSAAGVVFAKWPCLASRLLWLSGPVLLVCSLVWAFHRGYFSGRIRMLVAILAACAWCAGICAAKIRRKIPLFAMK